MFITDQLNLLGTLFSRPSIGCGAVLRQLKKQSIPVFDAIAVDKNRIHFITTYELKLATLPSCDYYYIDFE